MSQADESPAASADRLVVRPAPTAEEAAAIAAAVTLLSGSAPAEAAAADVPRWRFSGRWWTKPVPARRVRP